MNRLFNITFEQSIVLAGKASGSVAILSFIESQQALFSASDDFVEVIEARASFKTRPK